MCLRWPFFLQICHLSSRRSPKPVIWHLGLCLARTLHITSGSKYSGSSVWPLSLSWLSPWQGHVPVRVQEAPASCEGILHPSGGAATPGIATAVYAFAYANYCLQHCSSARECSLGCGSPQLSWHGEKSSERQEQMLLKAPANAPSVGFSSSLTGDCLQPVWEGTWEEIR